MSYYATYEGTIVFNDNFQYPEDSTKIEEAFKKGFDEIFNIEENENGEVFTFLAGGKNYREDLLCDCYEMLTPFIKSAAIEFVGEDNILWKHAFENGAWNEYNGSVIYSDEPNVILKNKSQAS